MDVSLRLSCLFLFLQDGANDSTQWSCSLALLSLVGEAQLSRRVCLRASTALWTGAFSWLWPVRKRQVCQGSGGERYRKQGCRVPAWESCEWGALCLGSDGMSGKQAQEGLRGTLLRLAPAPPQGRFRSYLRGAPAERWSPGEQDVPRKSAWR